MSTGNIVKSATIRATRLFGLGVAVSSSIAIVAMLLTLLPAVAPLSSTAATVSPTPPAAVVTAPSTSTPALPPVTALHGTAPAPVPATPAFSASQVAAAVDIVTDPDYGSFRKVLRWEKSELTYSLDLPASYNPVMTGYVHDALGWITSTTGVTFTRVDSAADIAIGGYKNNGGHVDVRASSAGVITHADVSIGCCYERVAYEELAQAMGPLGDRADSGSIFSQDRVRQVPSEFDAWLMSMVYQASPGESTLRFTQRLNESLTTSHATSR